MSTLAQLLNISQFHDMNNRHLQYIDDEYEKEQQDLAELTELNRKRQELLDEKSEKTADIESQITQCESGIKTENVKQKKMLQKYQELKVVFFRLTQNFKNAPLLGY